MRTEIVIEKLKNELTLLQKQLSQSQIEKNFFQKLLCSHPQAHLEKEIFSLLSKNWAIQYFAFYVFKEDEKALCLAEKFISAYNGMIEEKIFLTNHENPIISVFNQKDKESSLYHNGNKIFYPLSIDKNQKGISCLFLRDTVIQEEEISKIGTLLQILSYYLSLQFKEKLIDSLKAKNHRLSTLFKRLNSTLDIDLITQFLIEEMDISLKPEGYIISFLDESEKNLFVKSLKFFEEQKEIESIVLNNEFFLDKSEVNKICIQENRTIILNETNFENYGENAKNFFNYFKIKHAAFVPISNKEKDSEPIGLICIFFKNGSLPENKIKGFQKKISLFYNPLKNSFIIFQIRAKEKDIEKATEKNKKILETVDKISKLSSLELIYQNIIESILNLFQFDLGLLFLEKNNFLKYSFGQSRTNPVITDVFYKIDKLFQEEKGYEITVHDGATSISFIQKKHFYLPNVQALLNMPMSRKDTKGIELLENPKTLLLLPIIKDDKPIGVIQFWSLINIVHLSETDLVVLNLLCSFIGTAIANAELYNLVGKQNKNLEEKNKIIQQKNKQFMDELKLARDIQNKLIPSKMPELGGIRIAAYYKPMEEVGGDFYDFLPFKEKNELGLFISDVSGHGVPAALITSMVKTLMETAGEQRKKPSEMLSYINQKITGLTGGNFLTAFYAVYNQETQKLRFARGAHNPPFLIRGQKIIELSSRGKILGIDKNIEFEQQEFEIQKGDKILFYTDGLTEATNSQGIMFEEVLPVKLLEHKNKPAEEYLEYIYHALVNHQDGIKFDDDVCIIVLEITE